MKLTMMVLFVITLAGGMNVQAASSPGSGWQSLFNGKDLTGWELTEAAAEAWKVVDGVIDCDPKRRYAGGRSDLWTEESFGDFVLYVEWRFTDTPTEDTFPKIGPDGRPVRDEDGNVVRITFPNADSGIYLRGMQKAQVNIWNWPIGSGEVWGYRTDGDMPDEVVAAVTPSVRADHPVGEWNTYVISMIGDRLSVILNGERVIDHARLPGVAETGPIGLQFHGGYDHEAGQYRRASSLVQFRNLYVKPL